MGLQKITVSAELYCKENNITRAFNKIDIKVKVKQQDLVYQYTLSLICYVISDYNINPPRKYITILSIRILRYVLICTLGRSVFYYIEAVVLRCSVKNVL